MAAVPKPEPQEKPPAKSSTTDLPSVNLTGFRSSWFGFNLAFVWLFLIQLVGVYCFTTGFLLTRPVLDLVNTDAAPLKPAFEKAVVVVIDALRFDFVMPAGGPSTDGPKYYYHDNFPYLYEYTQKNPENAFLLKFIADPPTTTLQRLKGLTTGSLPAFVDAGSNFAGTEILEDSWVSQLYAQNKTIAFMGDDTWSALFQSKFAPELNFPYPSLNVWDLDTVDNGVVEHLMPLLDQPNKWDVAIAHLLGVDHAGHRYGPNHPAMKSKLQQMNQFIQDVMAKIDDNTLLIVMGDHGMDNKGDHGGDSTLELESTLWVYSKRKGLLNNKVGGYDVSNRGKNYRQVNQIDLVPTISLLLGLPIPYNNLGFPILEAFPQKHWNTVAQAATEQIETYRKHIINSGAEHQHASDLYQLSKDYKSCSEFQKYILDTCHERWVEFDMTSIYIGLAIIIASLAASIALYILANNSIQLEAVNVIRQTGIVSATGIAGGLLGYARNQDVAEAAAALAVGALAGFLFIFICQTIAAQTLPKHTFEDCKQWFLYFAVTLVHCALFGSNSFTVWEDSIVNYILCTFALIGVIKAISSTKRFFLWHSVATLILLSITSYSRVCREEQSSPSYQCKSTFYAEGSSTSSIYAVIGHFFTTLLLPQLVKAFYLMSGSYTGSAPLYIGVGLHILMALSFLYWASELLENTQLLLTKPLLTSAVRQTKLAIARIGLGASFVAWLYSWFRGKLLCVELNVEAAKTGAKSGQSLIKGYTNIYGSHYFLLVLGVFAGFSFLNKPMGDIVLSLMIYLILSALERVSLGSTSESRSNNKLLVALVCMTGTSFFFKTGHQVAIPAIQWDVGFVPSYDIVFPFTHLAIAFNTFGGIIISVLVIPLLIIWGIPPSKAPKRVLGRITTKLVLVNMYYTLLAIMSMIMATHFRRHLMVWKVFAPRYMFSVLSLLIVDITCVLTLLASGNTVRYISSVFV